MKVLTELVHLLDATAEDRWRAGHPSTRPRTSAADRAHDATRAADPTAETATDPARIRLAEAWRSALRHAQVLAAVANEERPAAIDAAEEETSHHLAELARAYAWWLGPESA